eukprot:COSAG06_NODE_17641_length_928_cov_2.178528_2_plen_119_part_00
MLAPLFSLLLKSNDELPRHARDRRKGSSTVSHAQFWEQISPELKAKIEVAALDAAQAERKESIADIDVVKARCKEDDIEVVTMSAEERARFKEATAYLYPKFDSMFSPGLVESISATA